MRAPEMQLYVFSMSCRSMGTLLKGQLFSLLYFCSTSCWYPAYLSVSSSVLSRLNNLSKGACSPYGAGRGAAGCVVVSRCPLLGTLLIWALKGGEKEEVWKSSSFWWPLLPGLRAAPNGLPFPPTVLFKESYGGKTEGRHWHTQGHQASVSGNYLVIPSKEH